MVQAAAGGSARCPVTSHQTVADRDAAIWGIDAAGICAAIIDHAASIDRDGHRTGTARDMQAARTPARVGNDRTLAQIAVDILSDYLDAIYAQMSAKQAAVIMELLEGKSQQEAAEKLGLFACCRDHAAQGRCLSGAGG